jgi:hypothetical protein
MNRTTTYLLILNSLICAYFFINSFVFGRFFSAARTIRSDLIQGVLIGFALAFITAQVYARIKAVRVNGWVTMLGLGEPSNGPLLRAAHAQFFPGPANTAPEAVYWWTNTDSAGLALTGARAYVLRFSAGHLPPNDAFWSITMADARSRFAANPLGRYSVSNRTGLLPNPDGSVDILIQPAAPVGRESNWLPAPPGRFVLWLRVYLPGPAVRNGAYSVPAVVEVQ